MKTIIGKKLKLLRKQKGLTIAQLHKAIGVCSNTISNWENGKTLIKTHNIIKVADFFNVRINYLLGREK